MRTWLKNLLLACLVFTLCWGGALWYWRSHNTMPGSADVILYLIVLPAVVLFLLWFARKLVLLAGAAPVAAAAPAAAPAAPAPVPAPPLYLVAGALRLPHGQSAGAFRDALDASEARPALDTALADDHGFPVMTARVPGLDTADTEAALAAWLRDEALPDPGFNEEQWRALALGADVAIELGQEAGVHALLHDDDEHKAPAVPMLQLLPLLPSDWNAGQRAAAGRWLLHLVRQQGWPAGRLAVSAAVEAGDAEPLLLAARLARQSRAAGEPYLAIVLACASHLGDTTIDAWSAGGLLFTARHQRGRIPGEGAAGLLLADAAQASLLDASAAPQLHAAAHAAHGASTDRPGNVDASVLTNLGRDAILTADSRPDDVQLVVGDADHRGSRNGELLAAAGACAPRLDAATQVIGVAASCGHAGPVAALAALVLAREETLENASHVLYLSNQDPRQRTAAIVRPRPEPAAAAQVAATASAA